MFFCDELIVINSELPAVQVDCAFDSPREGSRDAVLLAQPCNCKAAEPETGLQSAALAVLILQTSTTRSNGHSYEEDLYY